MKYVLLIGMLFMSTLSYAGLTVDDESYVKTKFAIEQLNAQRTAIIVERDGLLQAEDVKANQAKQIIMTTYEAQIDSIEAQINTKTQELDNLIK